MKKIMFAGALAAAMLCGAAVARAQKIGYLNSSALLAQMPEVKEADSRLDVYQKQKQKQFQAKVEAFQKKYEDLDKKQKAGQLSKIQLETEGKKLQEEQSKLAQEEQDIMKEMQQKREKELQPILDRVNKVIADMAKEKGYTYVLDSSNPILLYADESFDLSDAVKQKLGIPATPATPATDNTKKQ